MVDSSANVLSYDFVLIHVLRVKNYIKDYM